MYESKKEPLAPVEIYRRRILYQCFIAALLLVFFLLIGTLGYHFLAPANWIDSLHNASMILSGMGPVIDIQTTGGKIFSSAYAIFSGIAFITNIGLIVTPYVHRFFHKLHLDDMES